MRYWTLTFPKRLLNNAKKDWNKCKLCKLHRTRQKVVFGTGPYTASILIIGEAPGYQEDKAGKPFIGKAGRLLRKVLSHPNIDLEKKVFITNTVGCLPKRGMGFRKPTDEEIETCFPRIQTILAIIRPSIVVLLGNSALSLINKNGITTQRGWHTRHGEFSGILIYATLHPSYLLRQGGSGNKELFKSYFKDWYRIKKGMEKLNGVHND